MSDRISLKAQNHVPKLRTEHEEDEATGCQSGVIPPGNPPSAMTGKWFFSQPSSSSSYGSSQLYTTFPVLSADGASVYFNYANPGRHHVTGQTCPSHVTQLLPIAFLPSSNPFQFSAMPHYISQGTSRSVPTVNTPEHIIRAPPISCLPGWAADRYATTPQPTSLGVGCGVSHVADHSLPQVIHESHAQHAAASQSCPQVTIRRSDPNKKMTPEEVYMYMFCSPEWRIDEKTCKNGKFKGRTRYVFTNLVIPKKFRSIKSVEEYIRTNKIPNPVPKKKMRKQEADTMVEGESSELSKKMKQSA